MIYQENFKIGLKDIGIKNEVTNIALLEYLEDVAAYHSDSVGYGINSQKETKVSWILLNWKLKVIKRPKYGQILTIRTWSRKIVKCCAYRDFEIYDENHNLCVIATSKWLLISSLTGKIAKVEETMANRYESETEKSVFQEAITEKLKEPKNYKNSIIYNVKRKDIDIIGHMHNLYYLDLAYEVLPEEVYKQRPFNEVEIMYKREIKLGDTVIGKYSYENDKHIVVIQSQDEKTLHAILELKK